MKWIESKEIPLKDIVPCPLLIDRDEGDLKEITGEIFTAPIVRISKTQPSKFERITGYRRLMKCENEKKVSIRCDIYEMSDEEAVLTHTKENLQRKALTPIEEGKEYQNDLTRLSEIRGVYVTQEELARLLTESGKKTSQEKVSNMLRLLSLAEPVQKYLVLNKLGVYKALLLLRIKDKETQVHVAREIVVREFTDEQAEALITRLNEMYSRYQKAGQYIFSKGKFFLPKGEVTESKIGNILCNICCERIIEVMTEAYECQKYNSTKCNNCSAQKLCTEAVKLHNLREITDYRKNKNKDKENTTLIAQVVA
jgi:ParB/RepB/Spo0J family partition protein